MKKKKLTPLWEITPPDGPVSYLFGTVHAPDSRAFVWIDAAVERLLSCDCFAGEFDLGEMSDVALDTGIRLPAGQTLKELLPRGAWKQLEFLAKKCLNTDAGALIGQHPFIVWSALMKGNLQSDYDTSPDEMLWQTAMNAGKKVAGMESLIGQIDIVRRIPVSAHAANLVRYLKHHRSAQRQTDYMLRMYATGNIQELGRVARKSLHNQRQALSDERNIRMATRFEALSSDQSLFCAVGVAHLGGSTGILRLLKQRGMRVKPDKKSLEPFRH
jgi:uncharacterized protein YbaP (TraB family)